MRPRSADFCISPDRRRRPGHLSALAARHGVHLHVGWQALRPPVTLVHLQPALGGICTSVDLAVGSGLPCTYVPPRGGICTSVDLAVRSGSPCTSVPPWGVSARRLVHPPLPVTGRAPTSRHGGYLHVGRSRRWVRIAVYLRPAVGGICTSVDLAVGSGLPCTYVPPWGVSARRLVHVPPPVHRRAPTSRHGGYLHAGMAVSAGANAP
jgi:hypothetical protein